jgi:hypothetical protein
LRKNFRYGPRRAEQFSGKDSSSTLIAREARIDRSRAACKITLMKSAYELAMERLNKNSPAIKLTAEQKKEIAELDSLYASKIAQREIFLQGEIAKAESTGDFEAIEQLQKQLSSERKTLSAELEEKKEAVRPKGK